MADSSASPAAAHNTARVPESEISLRIISPSNDLADFPILRGLSASTTVREVRIMVEKELHSRMISIGGMRLIYRGRMVDADHKTLLEVIGPAALKETELHTLHLVLREPTIVNPNLPSSPAAALARPLHPPPAQPAQQAQPAQPAQSAQLAEQAHAYSPAGSQPMVAGPSGHSNHPIHPHQFPQAQVFVHQNQLTEDQARAAARQNFLDRRAAILEAVRATPQPTFARNGYSVTTRAAQAPQGPQSPQGPQAVQAHQAHQAHHVHHLHHIHPAHQAQQAHHTHHVHHVHLAQQAQQEHQAHHTHHTHHTHHLHHANNPHEALQAHHNIVANVHLQQFFAAADSANRNGPTAPGLRHRNVPHQQEPSPTMGQSTSSNVHPENEAPAVYILESPEGPRALLINASGTAYYSPVVPGPTAPVGTQTPRPIHYQQTTFPQVAQPNANDLIREHNERYQNQHQNHLNLARQHLRHMELLRSLEQEHLRDPRLHQVQAQDAFRPPPVQPAHHAHHAHHAPGQPADDGIPQLQANLLRARGHPVNNAGFLAAVWPQIWLVARLILFIWWFTHPTASWTRWTTVILLAAAVFIVNTGMLDSLANRLWIPIRAHLDSLLQVGNPGDEAGQENAEAPANNNAGEPAAVAGRANGVAPNPADVARRLVERRQLANGERLMNFARSLERFGILFLASLAPGIAERHVQLVEEQERRRQRQIREQEEAAATAAAAAAEAAAAAVVESEASTDKDAENDASDEAEAMASGSEKPTVAADGVPVN